MLITQIKHTIPQVDTHAHVDTLAHTYSQAHMHMHARIHGHTHTHTHTNSLKVNALYLIMPFLPLGKK